MEKDEELDEIDLLRLAKLLLENIVIIALAAFIGATSTFCYSRFFVTPLYDASAKMYVNNSSFNLGNTSLSISSSDISASQSLVDTYIVILKTRNTLQSVIEATGVDYTYEELYKMVSANAVNSTEIFEVTVTSSNPREAEKIANSIVSILPDKISSIVSGSSVRVVDYAVVPTKKVSPSILKYTLIGFMAGLVLSAAAIIVIDLLDNIIRSSEDITSYNIPILSVIPNIRPNSSKGDYGYYSNNGYGYKYRGYKYYKGNKK